MNVRDATSLRAAGWLMIAMTFGCWGLSSLVAPGS